MDDRYRSLSFCLAEFVISVYKHTHHRVKRFVTSVKTPASSPDLSTLRPVFYLIQHVCLVHSEHLSDLPGAKARIVCFYRLLLYFFRIQRLRFSIV